MQGLGERGGGGAVRDRVFRRTDEEAFRKGVSKLNHCSVVRQLTLKWAL